MANLTPTSVLELRFGVSRHALKRHRANHLTATQRAAILAASKPISATELANLQKSESEGLLSALITMRTRLQMDAEKARAMGDVRAAAVCERSILQALEVSAKLVGSLVNRTEVTTTHVLASPDYLRMRSALVRALEPFPEAARAVSRALHDLETSAAEAITNAAAKKPMLTIEHQPESQQ